MRYRTWMALADHEYARILGLLRTLDDQDWDRPTDCDGWTVRDLVAHLVGAAEATASVREQLRQQRAGKARQGGGERMAAVNAVQVAERRDRSGPELVDELADAAGRGLRARRRIPAPVRWPRFPFPAPLGWASLGHLNGAVYTRDAWMHRLDLSRATDRPPELTADHDGLIVSDLIEAWRAAARPEREPEAAVDGGLDADGVPTAAAIELCQALAGRGHVDGITARLALF